MKIQRGQLGDRTGKRRQEREKRGKQLNLHEKGHKMGY